jgi:tyrosine-specific transport protein
MKSERRIFWRATIPFIGSVIGVGIFGIPYVFAQAGFGIGLLHLLLIGAVNLVILLIYADIVMNTKGHHRISGIVERYAGPWWGHVASLLLFAASWGAMVAYVIIGGEFLQTIFSFWLDWSLISWQILFFAVSAILLIGGLGFIARLEVVFVIGLLALLLVILLAGIPHAEISELVVNDVSMWFLPFGVVLFAFGGMAALPEMADVLGRKKSLLRKAIMTGVVIVSIVYTLFAAITVAVTGIGTTPEAILGLGAVIGDWALILGAVIGLFSVFTSFLILGIAIMNGFVFDYKWRYFRAWWVAIIVPFVIFLAGARDFIDVIGFTGAILLGLLSLLLIFTYTKAKRDMCTPKRCLRIPRPLLWLTAIVFLGGIIFTILT